PLFQDELIALPLLEPFPARVPACESSREVQAPDLFLEASNRTVRVWPQPQLADPLSENLRVAAGNIPFAKRCPPPTTPQGLLVVRSDDRLVRGSNRVFVLLNQMVESSLYLIAYDSSPFKLYPFSI